METNTQPKRRIPIYKRRQFWGVSLIALVLAAGAALFFFVQEAPVKDANSDGRGVLKIDTEPDGATVLIDGKERDERTDDTFSVPTGEHTVTLRLDGYDEATVQVKIDDTNGAARPVTIDYTLTKQGLTPVTESVSEFKTYQNGTYGYSIKYPSRWKVEEHSAGSVVFIDTKAAGPAGEGEERAPLTILTQDNPQSLGPEAWYKARPEYKEEDQSQIKQKKTTVHGLQAYQYQTPYGFTPYLITVVTNGDQAFLFQQIKDSPDRQLYDQALQTLTFSD